MFGKARQGTAVYAQVGIDSGGLAASFDNVKGVEIAHNFGALHINIDRQLVADQLSNVPASQDETRRLLQQLKDAWSEIVHILRLPAVSAVTTGA